VSAGRPAGASVSVVQRRLEVDTRPLGRGLHEITRAVAELLAGTGVRTGLLHLFVQHTSASLVIQENADPTARADLTAWLDRLAPEDDPRYSHTAEGADDMPAHLKSVLTGCAVQVPLTDGRLALGTWQGIFLCEHRQRGGRRSLVATFLGTG